MAILRDSASNLLNAYRASGSTTPVSAAQPMNIPRQETQMPSNLDRYTPPFTDAQYTDRTVDPPAYYQSLMSDREYHTIILIPQQQQQQQLQQLQQQQVYTPSQWQDNQSQRQDNQSSYSARGRTGIISNMRAQRNGRFDDQSERRTLLGRTPMRNRSRQSRIGGLRSRDGPIHRLLA